MNATDSVACGVCGADDLRVSISLGEQPASNRFTHLNERGVERDRYPLSLGYCGRCATAQLVERMPIDFVRTRFDWTDYREPEGHLDAMADALSAFATGPQARFLGVTHLDKTTMDRLASRGFANSIVIDEADLNCPSRPFGLETIQGLLSDKAVVADISTKYGKADLLVARRIAEHAVSPVEFIKSLKTLVAPGGYLVLDLPDSSRIFRAQNHAFVWEEHISYFTEQSVGQLIYASGAHLVNLHRYPYAYEDSLVVTMRFDQPDRTDSKSPPADVDAVAAELSEFSSGLQVARQRWRLCLQELRRRYGEIAVFGGGHLAAKFINFYKLADLIDCVVDDQPQMQGMFMPGSALPIVPSADLMPRGIKVCISTLSPESEIRVRDRFAAYFAGGGTFIPAFSTGQNALHEFAIY